MTNEPTNKEIKTVFHKVAKQIGFMTFPEKANQVFARHFYRLGYEKGKEWKPEGTISIRALMAKNNRLMEEIKEAEQRGREQALDDLWGLYSSEAGSRMAIYELIAAIRGATKKVK